MPTNEERREVAEIMRDGTRFSVSSCAVAARLGLDCEEYESCEECEKDLADCLADLIEPEERTCRNIHPDVFQCSECYAIDDDWKNPPYCHGCGARVIE